MAVFQNSDQLNLALRTLFERIYGDGQGSAQALFETSLIIRFRVSSPAAEVVINGRKKPPLVTYGKSTLRPDLDIDVTGDALHQILLCDMPLSKAIATGKMKVRGALLKSYALEGILHSGQRLYPQIVQEMGLAGC